MPHEDTVAKVAAPAHGHEQLPAKKAPAKEAHAAGTTAAGGAGAGASATDQKPPLPPGMHSATKSADSEVDDEGQFKHSGVASIAHVDELGRSEAEILRDKAAAAATKGH